MYQVYHCIIWVAVIAVLVFTGCSDSESPTDMGPLTGDTTPPAAVSDAVLVLSNVTGEAVLEWTAPHDDSQDDRVARYEIHFSYTQGFDPPDFWDVSTPVPNPPDPGDPGDRERYSFETPRMARDLHVGIRSFDEAGNRSPSSNLTTVHVPGYTFSGRCEDVFSRAPLEGLAAGPRRGVPVGGLQLLAGASFRSGIGVEGDPPRAEAGRRFPVDGAQRGALAVQALASHGKLSHSGRLAHRSAASEDGHAVRRGGGVEKERIQGAARHRVGRHVGSRTLSELVEMARDPASLRGVGPGVAFAALPLSCCGG